MFQYRSHEYKCFNKKNKKMKRVVAYQTNDGIIFTCRKSAVRHELENAIRENLPDMIDKVSGCPLPDDVLEQIAFSFLLSNVEKLREIFNNCTQEPEEVRQPNID